MAQHCTPKRLRPRHSSWAGSSKRTLVLMFCLLFRVGYILIFAIRLSWVYTCPDSQVGYETSGMLNFISLFKCGRLQCSVMNVGLSYSTRSLFSDPAVPRTPLPLFIPTDIFSNQYQSSQMRASATASHLLPETAAPSRQCAKTGTSHKADLRMSEETYALRLI